MRTIRKNLVMEATRQIRVAAEWIADHRTSITSSEQIIENGKIKLADSHRLNRLVELEGFISDENKKKDEIRKQEDKENESNDKSEKHERESLKDEDTDNEELSQEKDDESCTERNNQVDDTQDELIKSMQEKIEQELNKEEQEQNKEEQEEQEQKKEEQEQKQEDQEYDQDEIDPKEPDGIEKSIEDRAGIKAEPSENNTINENDVEQEQREEKRP